MNSLAEAHIAKGRYDEAAKVLEKLIQREPQNAQHRNKLQFVRSQMGGVDTIPAPKPAPAAPPPPMSMPSLEIEEPAPSFDMVEPEPSFDLGLDASEPLELDLSMDAGPSIAPPPPPPRPQAPPPPRLTPAVELAAQELSDEADEDLDFITEHLTEAEVFAKYGLAEKAAEHLRAVLERVPKNLPAHEKLFRILLDEGDVDGARTAATSYVAILQERGDDDTIATVKNEFTSRGQSFDARPVAPKRAPTIERPAPMPAPPPVIEPEPEFVADLDTADEISFDLDAPATTDFAEISEPEIIEEIEESIPLAQEETVEETTSIDEISFGDLEPEPVAATAEQPFFGVESLAGELAIEEPSSEEIGEIDFYIGQELFDEARRKVDALLARYPSNSELTSRKRRIESAAAAHAAPAPAAPRTPPPTPASISRAEIESELLSAIPDDEEEILAPPPPPATPPLPMPAIASAAHEENLFADEDDFFDLASELENELSEDEEPVALGEEEQSLEEIFKEFKKGVEQQLDSEDYDTHYNLGIAYKEMGLIDEAIGEFQLASKDPKRAVECASMLGLCFLEKGMPQLAIKWYRKGLEMPEISEEEHVGLLYDLGSAYMEVGDTDNAQKAFMEVYGMNGNYRDIVSRIKELEDARK